MSERTPLINQPNLYDPAYKSLINFDRSIDVTINNDLNNQNENNHFFMHICSFIKRYEQIIKYVLLQAFSCGNLLSSCKIASPVPATSVLITIGKMTCIFSSSSSLAFLSKNGCDDAKTNKHPAG